MEFTKVLRLQKEIKSINPVNIIDQHHRYCLDIKYVTPHFSNTSPSNASALPQFRTR